MVIELRPERESSVAVRQISTDTENVAADLRNALPGRENLSLKRRAKVTS